MKLEEVARIGGCAVGCRDDLVRDVVGFVLEPEPEPRKTSRSFFSGRTDSALLAASEASSLGEDGEFQVQEGVPIRAVKKISGA